MTERAEHLKELLRRHTRVLGDVEAAVQGFCLLEGGEFPLSEVVLTGAATIYARSFVTVNGQKTYSIKRLKSCSGFDREVHDHLIELRNKALAHHDSDVIFTEISCRTIGVNRDGLSQALPFEIEGCSRTFSGYVRPEFLARIITHGKACWDGVRALWDATAEELVAELSTMDAATKAGEGLTFNGKNIRGTKARVFIPVKAARVELEHVSFADEYLLSPTTYRYGPSAITIWKPDGTFEIAPIKYVETDEILGDIHQTSQ